MIYLVSHGDTSCTNDSKDQKADIACGWLDVPLTDVGRAEARRLGQFFRGRSIDLLVSSDLRRARETAEGISAVIGVPVAGSYRELRPWNLGVFAGRPSTQVHAAIDDYVRHPAQRIDGGESLQQFYQRYIPALRGLMSGFGDVLVVTHSRNLDLAKGWVDVGARDEVDLTRLLADPTGPGTVLVLEQTGRRWEARVLGQRG